MVRGRKKKKDSKERLIFNCELMCLFVRGNGTFEYFIHFYPSYNCLRTSAETRVVTNMDSRSPQFCPAENEQRESASPKNRQESSDSNEVR